MSFVPSFYQQSCNNSSGEWANVFHPYVWMNEYHYQVLDPLKDKVLCVFVCVHLPVVHFKTGVHLCSSLGWLHVALNLNFWRIFFPVCVCSCPPGLHAACSGIMTMCLPPQSSLMAALLPHLLSGCRLQVTYQETLSCNCEAVSSCGEAAGDSPELPTAGREGLKRGGVPLKCKITTAVQCGGGSHLMMERVCVWWCVNVCPFDSCMCVSTRMSVCW